MNTPLSGCTRPLTGCMLYGNIRLENKFILRKIMRNRNMKDQRIIMIDSSRRQYGKRI